MGMTLAEKILAKKSGRDKVKPGEYVTASIDLAVVHEALAMVYLVLAKAGVKKVWDSSKVVGVLDHLVPAPNERSAEGQRLARMAARQFEIQTFYGERAGIMHQVVPEKGHVTPGMLIVGTDSHTITYGAFGAAATGIGTSEMAYVLALGRLWFRVPETIRFDLKGELKHRVMSKDVILYIAGRYSTEVAQYKAIEFSGPGAKRLSIDSRMTISNMAVEIGAKFGFFEPDAKTINYLKNRSKLQYEVLTADDDARYERVYEVDMSAIEPQVALPFSVGNAKPVSEVGDVKIDQALIGSCTNGRLEDLRIAADILRGKKVHQDTRLLVIPASWEVYLEAMKQGIIEDLVQSGAIICNCGCGPCFGAHMGLLASGERCIASINRNFKGRMGSAKAEVYLASPATVAASAIAGKIVDPRLY